MDNVEESKTSSEEKLGKLAFTYCKIATLSLLAGRYVLPIAAALSATFFIASYLKGKKSTKCYLRYPLLAAALWICVLGLWFALQIFPNLGPDWIRNLHHL